MHYWLHSTKAKIVRGPWFCIDFFVDFRFIFHKCIKIHQTRTKNWVNFWTHKNCLWIKEISASLWTCFDLYLFLYDFSPFFILCFGSFFIVWSSVFGAIICIIVLNRFSFSFFFAATHHHHHLRDNETVEVSMKIHTSVSLSTFSNWYYGYFLHIHNTNATHINK